MRDSNELRQHPEFLPFYLASFVAAAVLGASLATSQAVLLTAAIIGFAGVVAATAGWRPFLTGLFRYLPFAGVLTVLLYPNVGRAALVKDLLFVLPLYAAFLPELRKISLKGFPRTVGVPVVGYACLALGHALLAGLQRAPIVGIVGLRVTVMYLPLLVVGWVAGARAGYAHEYARVAVRWSTASALIVIIQGALIYGNAQQLALAPYGDAAPAMTQAYAHFDLGWIQVRRVPGTYPFVTQAFAHLLFATILAFSLWRSSHRKRWDGAHALICGLATVTTGARFAWISVPFVILAVWFLSRRRERRSSPWIWIAPVIIAAVLFTAGTYLLDMGRHVAALFGQQFQDVVIGGFSRVQELTFLGEGLGVGANAARHVAGEHFLQASGGVWLEGWYVRMQLELGVPGLFLAVAILLALASVLVKSCLNCRGQQDPLITAGAVTVLWVVGASLKGQFLDFDPLNVFFWLFCGLALRRVASIRRSRAMPA